MPKFKATYTDSQRVRLTDRFDDTDLELARTYAKKYATEHGYRLVSVEEVA